MKRALLISLLFMVGCTSAPLMPIKTIKLKDLPPELAIACPDLKNIDPNTTKLSDVITIVSKNYSEYHDCRAEVESLQEWYNSQKEIINNIK